MIFILPLPRDPFRVGLQRNGGRPDISVQIQKPIGPLPTPIEHGVAVVLEAFYLQDQIGQEAEVQLDFFHVSGGGMTSLSP